MLPDTSNRITMSTLLWHLNWSAAGNEIVLILL